MASYYLATSRDPAVNTFVIFSGGLGVPDDRRMDSIKNFIKIKKIKILDIYGSEDHKHVVAAVIKRQKLARKYQGNRYHMMKIEGAGHFYRGKEDKLISQLVQWLDKNL